MFYDWDVNCLRQSSIDITACCKNFLLRYRFYQDLMVDKVDCHWIEEVFLN